MYLLPVAVLKIAMGCYKTSDDIVSIQTDAINSLRYINHTCKHIVIYRYGNAKCKRLYLVATVLLSYE
jgi:hypothetical protein